MHTKLNETNVPLIHSWAEKSEATELLGLMSLSRTEDALNSLFGHLQKTSTQPMVISGYMDVKNPFMMSYLKDRPNPFTLDVPVIRKKINNETQVLIDNKEVEQVLFDRDQVRNFENSLTVSLADNTVDEINRTLEVLAKGELQSLNQRELYHTLQTLAKGNRKGLYNKELRYRHKATGEELPDLEDAMDDFYEGFYTASPEELMDEGADLVENPFAIEQVLNKNNPVYHRVVYEKLIAPSLRSANTNAMLRNEMGLNYRKLFEEITPEGVNVSAKELFDKDQYALYQQLMDEDVSKTIHKMALDDLHTITNSMRYENFNIKNKIIKQDDLRNPDLEITQKEFESDNFLWKPEGAYSRGVPREIPEDDIGLRPSLMGGFDLNVPSYEVANPKLKNAHGKEAIRAEYLWDQLKYFREKVRGEVDYGMSSDYKVSSEIDKSKPVTNFLETGLLDMGFDLNTLQGTERLRSFYDEGVRLKEFQSPVELKDSMNELIEVNSYDEFITHELTKYNNIGDAGGFANFALQRMGFDGITHVGGGIANDLALPHQVWIAFSPSQFKSVDNVGAWAFGKRDNIHTQMKEAYGDNFIAGQIRFSDGTEKASAEILLTELAEFDTLIHELGHMVRRTMLGHTDKKILQRWILDGKEGRREYNEVYKEALEQAEAGMARGVLPEEVEEQATELVERFVWSKEGEEKFANAFTDYLKGETRTGPKGTVTKGPMKGTFEEIRKNLELIYDMSEEGTKVLKLSDDVRLEFEKMFGRGEEAFPERLETPRALLDATAEVGETYWEKTKRWGTNNPLVKANLAIGSALENNSRMAHYIAMRTRDIGELPNGSVRKRKLNKSMTPEQARDSVKRFLFDYDELTDFEKDVMKNFIPFYTWMRKNIPLQIQEMYKNPQRYRELPNMFGSIEDMSPELENIPEHDYFKHITTVRMPFRSESLPFQRGGNPVYLNLDLPFSDLNKLNLKDQVSSISPLIKVWFEIYSDRGYSTFLDAPIERYEDEPEYAMYWDEDESIFGEQAWSLNKKTAHVINTLIPMAGKASRLHKRAKEGRLGEQLLREMTGLGFTTTDVDATVRSKIFRERKAGRALKERIRDKAEIMGLLDAVKSERKEAKDKK